MNLKKIAIVGSPNVGKSSIFNNLSGRYATVSNYPGTTVELFSSKINIKNIECEFIDTPGMYSFLPLSEEEKISRLILIKDKLDLVLHVGSARDLSRTLPLTLQLIEAGIPVVLVLNIMDEVQRNGIKIDVELLENILGVPVVPTISVRGEGIKKLKNTIAKALTSEKNFTVIKASKTIDYLEIVEDSLAAVVKALKGTYSISKRALSLLLLETDKEIFSLVRENETKKDFKTITATIDKVTVKFSQPIEYLVNVSLKNKTELIITKTVYQVKGRTDKLSRFLGDITLKPMTGVPILCLFLYFGLYKLVGEFGAGTCVDFLETEVFEKHLNPFFVNIFDQFIHIGPIKSLFVGEYGILTLGLRYAVAIIFPIVTIFFFVFSLAEDSGYLPRIGAMLDRLFKKIGLSGRAVIPMVLGLGCDTMATMVTRILPTKRERVIATLLLSLSVPCSAQLGVIMGILSGRGMALAIWFLVISGVFSFSGFFLNKMLKGKRPSFYIELPPLRIPRLKNIFTKTYVRLKWYFKEVMPIFIWASVLIWLGKITKVFDFCISVLSYPVKQIGLPDTMSKIFLFGFFRRDYGAAGLYDLEKQGLLSFRELVVAAVVLTLFLPCVAQLLMNIKERGLKFALGIMVFILFFSFFIGFVLNNVLLMMGVN